MMAGPCCGLWWNMLLLDLGRSFRVRRALSAAKLRDSRDGPRRLIFLGWGNVGTGKQVFFLHGYVYVGWH